MGLIFFASNLGMADSCLPPRAAMGRLLPVAKGSKRPKADLRPGLEFTKTDPFS